MSGNFHKTAVLKRRRIVNLSLTGLYKQLVRATPVPKFVRSLALDFPDICPQFLGVMNSVFATKMFPVLGSHSTPISLFLFLGGRHWTLT